MERGRALLLPLLLGLLQPGRGGRLEVDPPESEVAMAVGESRNFTCRMTCADGREASVLWRGLDTSLGAVQSGAGLSVLYVLNASLSAAGIRVCVGSCRDVSLQHRVRLLVFAFPDQLTVSPEAVVPGRDQEVACTAHNVTPAGPDTLSMSLLLGGRELEGVEDFPDVTEEPQEGEDQLFQVTQRWLLPTSETSSLHTLHCQVTMRLPGLELTRHRPIPEPSITASLEPTDTTTPEPFVMTPPKPPITTSPELTSTCSPASPGPVSPGPAPRNSSTRPCLPEIHRSSAPGALELLCEVPCGPGMAVHWTQAPGGLEAYETQEAGAQAWLSSRNMLWSGCHPEGWFQCRLDPGGHTTNLYVVPEICSPATSAALWTSSLALGLLLLVFLAYHLRKRCQPTS
ncbi:mucosal addressin cell adhesion molecule 1 isoform X2 [Cervus elaphus]|uniref:mucosal addressin cell adhesion molecule 1 isoform X2 n=1 Tax=Cervus elaphus TaxID=9860 RepID=UPI001CC2D563|nr:mucosal addressin cell adhesion molecule 1 isoform X2 [Cervus elaphus]